MLFALPRKRRRPWGFATSLLVHCGLVCLLFLGSEMPASERHTRPAEQKYAVLLLQFPAYPPDTPPEEHQQTHPSQSAPRDHGKSQAMDRPAGTDLAVALRPFVLPPVPQLDPVKQTILRLDVPPEIQLRREIPLPAVLLQGVRLPTRTFVPPAAPIPAVSRPTPNLPSAPQVSGAPSVATTHPNLATLLRNERLPVRPFAAPGAPGGEAGTTKPVADIPAAPRLAGVNPLVTITDPALARLLEHGGLPVRAFVAPGVVSSAAPKAAPQIPAPPQVAHANPVIAIADPNLAALLLRGQRVPTRTFQARPADPSGKSPAVRAIAAPPQITAPDLNAGNVVALLSLPNVPVYATMAAIPPANQVPPPEPSGSGGSGGRGGATAVSANATISPAGNTVSGMDDAALPGTTRLNFSKDGKFGAVVLGSSAAAPYVESIGALSGKLVYSAFVGVGLRKKWILQYSLPKGEEQKTSDKGRTEALEAPWPYHIVRPDQIGAADSNYVIVRGALTAEGHFDHLVLLFPTKLQNADLLMLALKRWLFRPATRDGAPTEVEILLIIPNQAE